MINAEKYRPIRSFVRRGGRITPSQRHALENLCSKYGIEYAPTIVDFSQYFARPADLILEIGFGNGESLLKMAIETPETDFIGIDVHPPGVGSLLAAIEKHSLTNLRIIYHDAVDVLTHMITDQSLSKVQIYFPDPWPKKRHHKRRLIQTSFVELLYRKLKPKGLLHLATDWEDYARQMMRILSSTKGLSNADAEGGFYKNASAHRPETKFELRGVRLGHQVSDLIFYKD